MINNLYSHAVNILPFQYNKVTQRQWEKWVFFPTSWPKLCSVLHNLQLILSKRDWERELFVSLLWNSVMQRENKCLLFSQKKRSICDDCQEGLAHLMMCKILIKGWKYFKLHLNFSRNSDKTHLWIYSGHLQGYSKETELILEFAALCKFIIM